MSASQHGESWRFVHAPSTFNDNGESASAEQCHLKRSEYTKRAKTNLNSIQNFYVILLAFSEFRCAVAFDPRFLPPIEDLLGT